MAILQSSVKSLAEVSRNQQRGEAYYKSLSPILSSVKKRGMDVGSLTKGLGKVYQTLLELNGEAPFEALDDLDRALKRIRSSKKPKESFDGYLVRLDTQNQCLQKLNRTVLGRLSNETQATKVACKRLGMEAVRSAAKAHQRRGPGVRRGLLSNADGDAGVLDGGGGVADLPKGKHLLYDAEPSSGVEAHDKGLGLRRAVRRGVAERFGRQDFFDVGDDERRGLERGPSGRRDLCGRRGAAGGGPWREGRRVLRFSGWSTATFVVEAYDASMRVADAPTSVRFLLRE